MTERKIAIRNGTLFIGGARVPILSGEVHFFRMDPQTWDSTLANVKALGLPIVSTYLSWRRFSIGPGRYDLEGKTDPRLDVERFLRLCGKHGLWVIMKPGPWICAEEPNGGYPDWLVDRGDLHVLDSAGNSVQGYNPPFCSPIPSYLHPSYLEAAGEWISEVDRTISRHVYPRGPIILVQLDNEPSMTFHDRLLESDYNPVNVGPGGLYQHWLQAKYATVAELNRAHCSSWKDFREVPAPRSLEITRPREVARYSDWVEFKERSIARHVACIRKMHVENGLDQVLFTINYNEHPQLGVPNDWRALESASGMGGFDYYPRMPLNPMGLSDVALHVNYSRVCNVVPWSPEIVSGTWSFEGQVHMPGAIESRDFEYLYLGCIAFGLKGMNFYMLADRDNWIDSPLDATGNPGPNAASIGDVIRLISSETEFEAFNRRQPVAVLYYRPHAREAFIADGGSLSPGAGDLGKSYGTFKSLFAELHRLNLDPAVADPWARPGSLAEHRLLFVPGGPSMDEPTLSVIDEAAGAGSTVVWAGPKPRRTPGFNRLSGEHRSLEGTAFDFKGENGKEELARILEKNSIRPEVEANVPGVYTVVHRCRARAWLFIINSRDAPETVELGFQDAGVVRMRALTGAGRTVTLDGSRARVTLEHRCVQAWELERS